MANILYGVNGEGSGHSSRAREVITHLQAQGHHVRVASFDRGYQNLKDDFEVTEIDGLRLAYVHNWVRYRRTVVRNLLHLPQATRTVRPPRTQGAGLGSRPRNHRLRTSHLSSRPQAWPARDCHRQPAPSHRHPDFLPTRISKGSCSCETGHPPDDASGERLPGHLILHAAREKKEDLPFFADPAQRNSGSDAVHRAARPRLPHRESSRVD